MLIRLILTALLLVIQFRTALVNEDQACKDFDKQLNKVKKCQFRHESQYEFTELFQGNCVNNTYCLCQKTIYVRYISYPPYIYKEKISGNVEGLLPGKY